MRRRMMIMMMMVVKMLLLLGGCQMRLGAGRSQPATVRASRPAAFGQRAVAAAGGRAESAPAVAVAPLAVGGLLGEQPLVRRLLVAGGRSKQFA